MHNTIKESKSDRDLRTEEDLEENQKLMFSADDENVRPNVES